MGADDEDVAVGDGLEDDEVAVGEAVDDEDVGWTGEGDGDGEVVGEALGEGAGVEEALGDGDGDGLVQTIFVGLQRFGGLPVADPTAMNTSSCSMTTASTIHPRERDSTDGACARP